MRNEQQTDTPNWYFSIAAAISCVGIVGLSFGLGLPLLAMNIEQMTGSGLSNGANAFAGAIATVVAAPFAPVILSKFPTRPLLVFALMLTAFSFIFYKMVPVLHLWLVMRFISGFAISILFIASEAWINQLTPDRLRSRMLSTYSIALAAGFAGGGLLVAYVGVTGWTPFLMGAVLCLAGALPLLAPGPGLIPPDPKKASPFILLSYFGKAPRIMMAALAFGAIETAATHFSPIWALRAGMDQSDALRLISMGAIGVIALQFPIGWLGDKMDRYRLLGICAFITFLAPIGMWLSMGLSTYAVYAFFFIYVGVGEGLYILALVLIGQKFDKQDLTTASAAVVLMYGLGSVSSPLIVGPMMDILDPHGAMYALAAFAFGYLLFIFGYHLRKGHKKA